MEQLKINSFTLNGISVRTKNRNEMNPEKAKIAGLWEKFGKKLGTAGMEPSEVFGVYTNYESDEQGAYDITTAVKGEFPSDRKVALTIPAGVYLKFSKTGSPKEVCMDLWQEIWTYFQRADSPQRTFICDFEEYAGMDAIAIYIGIEAR